MRQAQIERALEAERALLASLLGKRASLKDAVMSLRDGAASLRRDLASLRRKHKALARKRDRASLRLRKQLGKEISQVEDRLEKVLLRIDRSSKRLSSLATKIKASRSLSKRLEGNLKKLKIEMANLERREKARRSRQQKRRDAIKERAKLPRPDQAKYPLPAPPKPRELYTKLQLEEVSLLCEQWMRSFLCSCRDVVGGRVMVYRYPDSLEVDGELRWKLLPDADVSDMIGDLSQCFLDNPSIQSIYYGECFFKVEVRVLCKTEDLSPGEQRDKYRRSARYGYDVVTLDSYWVYASHSGALEAFRDMAKGVFDGKVADPLSIEHVEVIMRIHWNLDSKRPDRSDSRDDRSGAEERGCD